MRILRPVISSVLLVNVAACASASLNTAESVSRLEQQQKSSPTSAGVNRSLGIAYFEVKRYPEARAALETAAKLDPKDGTTSLYLGLTDEELNDLPAAKAAYSSYIQFGRTSRVRSQLQARLAALTRKELVAEAKTAVAQERALGGQAGDPRTIAVLPLKFQGADTTLLPLERGLADLLTTDLARSSQLTLVERSRMQAILDEIGLQQSGATDASSNVRVGKLIKAGRVVQGSILQVDANNVNVTGAVVNVSTSQIQGSPQSTANLLEQIFNIEKDLALKLFTQLGVTLTPAERNAIEQRPTRSLAAFIAYSNGLKAEDQGRYDDASRFFNDAVRIDPSFGAAQTKGQEARQISAGAQVTAATVESSLKGSSEGSVVNAAKNGSTTSNSNSGLGSSAQTTAADLNPSSSGSATGGASGSGGGGASQPGQVDPASSSTGSDNPTGTAKVTIVITRPKTP